MRNLKLFVYGTLREGHGNNPILGPNAKLLGKGTINAQLWVSNGLPMVTETADPNSKVVGEVWLLEDINRLADVDMLEGHPFWYRRKEVIVDGGDHWEGTEFIEAGELEAWCYFMQPAEVIAYGAARVESGDYEKVRSACS